MSLSNIPLFCSIDIQKFSIFIPVDTYYIPYFFYLLFMCSCLVYPWHMCHWMQSVQQPINQFIFRFLLDQYTHAGFPSRSSYVLGIILSFAKLFCCWFFFFFRLELFFSLPPRFFSPYVKVSPTVTSYHSSCYLKPTWGC